MTHSTVQENLSRSRDHSLAGGPGVLIESTGSSTGSKAINSS
ncbi:conserved hypothetical protein [Roseibium sp. TrichSKD4]|nr:conserved hypothetical protein [Roseibium sp. TrichSKD4]